ncbi:MAG: ACP S-malonyltransferase [Firmicutes bacterium]|nr:ACP S-malonyltransferase [Bacillota bacterium]
MDKAFLFPGQGSQQIQMGADLYAESAVAKEVFDLAQTIVPDLLSVCFGDDQALLDRTEYAQPAIVTVSAALWECLPAQTRVGYVTGHSLGEYSALYAAGVLGIAEVLQLVRERATLMARVAGRISGGMVAVMGLDYAEIQSLLVQLGLTDRLYPANRNSPQQTVLSGLDEAITEFSEAALARGAKVVRLGVSGPFHSPLMSGAAKEFAVVLNEFAFKEPSLPVISPTTGGMLRTAAEIREALINQLTGPVRWTETVVWLSKAGVRTVIEVGPGKVLTGLVKRTDPGLQRINISRLADVDTLL